MINLILLTTVAVTGCIASEKAGPVEYYELAEQAVFNCKNRSANDIDIAIVDKLIQIEKKYDVPNELRGMLLAAACSESGFNPNALGDRKFSKDGKTPRAVGLFQMWGWWSSSRYGYGIDRTDTQESGIAFMEHIVKQLNNTKKSCRYRTGKRQWIAAWVHAIRAPKQGGRCRETPKHLRILKKWHNNIQENRDNDMICQHEIVGC
tara:strand:- start:2933 stop:3550 length:618 start_codon:yes stop_codon:yes gene_type:complete